MASAFAVNADEKEEFQETFSMWVLSDSLFSGLHQDITGVWAYAREVTNLVGSTQGELSLNRIHWIWKGLSANDSDAQLQTFLSRVDQIMIFKKL